MNNRKRGTVPEEAEHLVAFVDVQGKLLYYVVCAFADNFTGYVIDYGAYPGQKRRYFSLNDANPTFETLYPNAGLEGRIYSALSDLTDSLLSRVFPRDDGAEMYIEKCVVDSAWGESTKTVYQFCRQSPFSRLLMPSKGKGITAAQKPYSEYRREPGVKLGFNWRIFRVKGRQSVRLFEYDTNFWKSFLRQRLFTAIGDPGSLTIFGSDEEALRLFAEHLSSETPTATSGGGRRVDVWKLIPGRENHFLDGVVGCLAAASVCGCDLQFEEKHTARGDRIRRERFKPEPALPVERIVPHGRIVPNGRIGPRR